LQIYLLFIVDVVVEMGML